MMDNEDGSKWKERRGSSQSYTKTNVLNSSKKEPCGIHSSLKDLELTLETQNLKHSDEKDVSLNFPSKFEKSIEVLRLLNHRMKALSFSPSSNEKLDDQHSRNVVVLDDEDGEKLSLKNPSLETDKMGDAEDDLTIPYYDQICELKDALKDAVLKLKSF